MSETKIQNFFNNSVVLLTGCTGVVGSVLLEKLLRSCQGIKKIYLLIRMKKNKQPEERLKELFEGEFWATMKILNPNYRDYISLINCDLMEKDLGMSEKDYEILTQQVTHIFHLAATVRFDEKLKTAILVNVRGTKKILEIASKCTSLISMVYVSSTYIQFDNNELEERFYKAPKDAEELIKLCENHSLEEMEELSSSILETYPNTYSFSKILAEDIVRRYSTNLPVSISRISVVLGCYKEPLVGWINNIFGPVAVIALAGLGILHVMPTTGKYILDYIPSDFCANQIIAVAYETGKNPDNKKNVKIYNLGTSNQNPLTWRQFFNWCNIYTEVFHPIQAIWICFIVNNLGTSYLYLFAKFFLHDIPYFLILLFLKITRNKSRLSELPKKVNKLLVLLFPYINNNWIFHDGNTKNLINKMEDKDKLLFYFDVKTIEWGVYVFYCMKYIRTNVVMEPLSNVDEAQKYLFRLKIIHYSTVAVCMFIVYKFLEFIFYMIF